MKKITHCLLRRSYGLVFRERVVDLQDSLNETQRKELIQLVKANQDPDDQEYTLVFDPLQSTTGKRSLRLGSEVQLGKKYELPHPILPHRKGGRHITVYLRSYMQDVEKKIPLLLLEQPPDDVIADQVLEISKEWDEGEEMPEAPQMKVRVWFDVDQVYMEGEVNGEIVSATLGSRGI